MMQSTGSQRVGDDLTELNWTNVSQVSDAI